MNESTLAKQLLNMKLDKSRFDAMDRAREASKTLPGVTLCVVLPTDAGAFSVHTKRFLPKAGGVVMAQYREGERVDSEDFVFDSDHQFEDFRIHEYANLIHGRTR